MVQRVRRVNEPTRKRGRQAHLRYFHEGLRSVSSDRRSFLASRVFGADALQIAILRAYRDWVLHLRRWVWLLVTAYIKAALSVCAALYHWLELTVRRLRDAFAAGYRRFRDRSGR